MAPVALRPARCPCPQRSRGHEEEGTEPLLAHPSRPKPLGSGENRLPLRNAPPTHARLSLCSWACREPVCFLAGGAEVGRKRCRTAPRHRPTHLWTGLRSLRLGEAQPPRIPSGRLIVLPGPGFKGYCTPYYLTGAPQQL